MNLSKTIPQLFILGTRLFDRPMSRRTIFVDGSPDATVRSGIDLELSHWSPNRTPEQFKADTSTEICMNFVSSEKVDCDLVVNNHVDVDGVLSVFTLLHPKIAVSHRKTIVSAAEIGDFWGWGEHHAQVLFQGLTRMIDTLATANTDPQGIYEECIRYVHRLIESNFIDPDVEASLTPLNKSVDWIVSKKIKRQELHPRFAHYIIPKELCKNRLEAALNIPSFNARISDECLFWPQARARWDREKVQLVSLEAIDGWHHDLWYPGYMWAETPNSWRAPGLSLNGSTNGYEFSNDSLKSAVRDLQGRESTEAVWALETVFSPFTAMLRKYPVVLSAVADNSSTPSSLSPETVAHRLAQVFEG